MSDTNFDNTAVAPLTVNTAAEPLTVPSITTWPTTEQLMNEETRDEAVVFAASEILGVHAQMVKTIRELHKTSIPKPIQLFFEKKCRTAMNNLYGGLPAQCAQHVELLVLTEMAGGPEALERMAKEIAEEEARINGVVDGKVTDAGCNPVAPGQEDSSSSNVTTIPKIPEQWPVQLGPDGALHIVKEPEKPLAKVLQFPGPKKPTGPQDEPPDGGTPVAIAA